jgi:hypothetical protein
MRTRQPRHLRGANAIEFALTAPIFLLLLFGLLDYGWLFMNKALADVAVARGCRSGAIVDPHAGSPQTAALDSMSGWVSLVNSENCKLNEWCQVQISGEVPTKRLSCTVTYPIAPLVGLGPFPQEVHSRTVTRLEWQRGN